MLTDEELAAIGALSAPLPPPDRSNFLQIVAARIAPYPPDARGPGLIYKVATQVQREILKGGTVAVGPGPKYTRGGKRRSRRA